MNNEVVKTLLYTSEDGAVAIKVIIDSENDTMWTTQKTMAELFDKNINTISKHLNNIFESEELVKSEVTFNPNDSTNSEIVIINPDAKTQPILYNLDAIISVGYRVNSKQATHFRRWATSVLKEYIVKGFALDDELLKKGSKFGKDYFNHLPSEFVKYVLQRENSIRKLQIYMQQVLITIWMLMRQKTSLPQYKTCCFLP